MSETIVEVGQLSRMKRELNTTTLEALQSPRGQYAKRLGEVATKTFMRSNLLGGTTICGPSVLTYGKRRRLREASVGGGMFVRNLETPEGRLTMFPLHIIGISTNKVPIIDPSIEGSYSIVHTPRDLESDRHNPAGMRVDLAFTVDTDDYVTVDGANHVTAEEFRLFNDIVTELENRAQILR